MRLAAALAAAALVAFTSCAGDSSARHANPRLWANVRHFAGSALVGPTPESRPVTELDNAEGACAVRFASASLERIPEDVLRPLASQARLIVAPSVEETVRPFTNLPVDAYGGLDNRRDNVLYKIDTGSFGRVVRHGDLTGALPRGVTVVFTLSNQPADSWFTPKSPPVKVHVHLTRLAADGKDRFLATIVFEDYGADSNPEDFSAIEGMPVADEERVKNIRRESILIEDSPVLDGDPLILTFASPFGSPEREAVVITVELTSPSMALGRMQGLWSRVVDRCYSDIEGSRTSALLRSRRLLPQEMQLRELEKAFENVDLTETVRPALVFLANSTQSFLTADFALVATPKMLREYVDALVHRAGATGQAAPRSAEEMTSLLELTTLGYLSARVGDVDFPVELQSVLTRTLGEVGRDPVAIEDLLRVPRFLPELRIEIVDRNREYLRYPSASSRVRAYDWLKVRELDPKGFDPLGPPGERRQALDEYDVRLEEEAAAAASRPSK